MRQSILVVDRDADHATWLVSELERFGFAAEHAATAAAALMAAERGSPDMVLLDPAHQEVGLGGVLDPDRPIWVADFGSEREPPQTRCHPWIMP